MATETETQTAKAGSKRSQLKERRNRLKMKAQSVGAQLAGGEANLSFDDTTKSSKKENEENKKESKDANKAGRGSKAEGDSGDKGMNFRQVMAQEKKKQKKKSDKKKKKSATYQGSKKALQMLWKTLVPSWFLNIFVIDIFAFLHLILPKFFCALGEEWESPIAAAAGVKTGSSTKTSLMKTVEPWLVILINIFVLVAIVIIIVAIMGIIAVSNPWIPAWIAVKELWDSITTAIGL